MAVGEAKVDGDFRIGEWVVSPALNQIASNGSRSRVEPKAMQVLLYLAEHPGVVSKEQLISSVWPGVFVSDDVLPGCISALRKAFNDNARRPRVIETIHKSGYRLLPPVAAVTAAETSGGAAIMRRSGKRLQFAMVAAILAFAVLLLAAFVWLPTRRRYDSIAVLPFVNDTHEADTEYLSNGIGQQIVDDLSQFNAVKVLAWTTVSHYDPRQKDVRAIGRDLNVKAILTGHLVRREDRVALQTELVDVSNGSQLWGQRYERSVADISSLQQAFARYRREFAPSPHG